MRETKKSESGVSRFRHAFSLLANARTFLESAADLVATQRGSDTRFAILHLATAIELLLKARLALHDHQLLVADSKQVTAEQFARGDFRSVGVDEAIKRLINASLLSLTNEQLKQISALRRLRNRVTHFCTPDGMEARGVLAAGISIFIELHDQEFQDNEVYGAKSMSRLLQELSDCRDFVEARRAHIADALHSAIRPRTRHFDECSDCLQDAAAIVGDYLVCLFCSSKATLHDRAELMSEDGSVGKCPACGREAVARLLSESEEDPSYECFCCGFYQGIEPPGWSDLDGHPLPRLKDEAGG